MKMEEDMWNNNVEYFTFFQFPRFEQKATSNDS